MALSCIDRELLQVKSSTEAREKGFNFNDARLMRGAWRNEPNPDSCRVNICLSCVEEKGNMSSIYSNNCYI